MKILLPLALWSLTIFPNLQAQEAIAREKWNEIYKVWSEAGDLHRRAELANNALRICLALRGTKNEAKVTKEVRHLVFNASSLLYEGDWIRQGVARFKDEEIIQMDHALKGQYYEMRNEVDELASLLVKFPMFTEEIGLEQIKRREVNRALERKVDSDFLELYLLSLEVRRHAIISKQSAAEGNDDKAESRKESELEDAEKFRAKWKVFVEKGGNASILRTLLDPSYLEKK